MECDYVEIKDILNTDDCRYYINKIDSLTRDFEIISNTFEDSVLSQKILEKLNTYITCNIGKNWYYADNSRLGIHKDGSTKNSFATILIYLNGNFEGGRTIFYDENTHITSIVVPSPGKAVLLKQDVYHEGESVIFGTKYVLRNDVARVDTS